MTGLSRLSAVVLLLATLAACDSGTAGTDRAWRTPPVEPAESLIAQRLPRTTYLGGPFLRHPQVVTVTFAGDAPGLVDRLEQFGATITHSTWWRAAVDQFCRTADDCVGDGVPAQPVRLSAAAPTAIRDVDVADLLRREAEVGRLGDLGLDSLLLVYLPAGTALTEVTVGVYCDGRARALHRSLLIGSQPMPYAVVPRCGEEAELTATASHEILEATTNPDPSRRGFAFESGGAGAGFTAAGVEPVDPCGLVTLDRHRTVADGFTVQRPWSDRAAAGGHNPCGPTDIPYLALVPERAALQLDVGQTANIALTAAADRPVAPWPVRAVDVTGLRSSTPCADVALDRTAVAAGETATLTITARAQPPSGRCVVGTLSGSAPDDTLWPLALTVEVHR
jgi:hypothetical protein